jgi:hypothetical protein
VDPLYGDACSAKFFEVLPLIFITDCCPIDWLQSVLKIRSFNFFLYFLNFFHASRFGGRVDPLFHPPPHVLYSGTNSTSEVPVSGFGVWILGDGSFNFGLILIFFLNRLIFSLGVTAVAPSTGYNLR